MLQHYHMGHHIYDANPYWEFGSTYNKKSD